jgi:hypothetical protein
MSLSKPIGPLVGGEGEFVVGVGDACQYFVSASLCRGNEDAPVIHMGMIVGMRGVSIRMRPLKGRTSIVVATTKWKRQNEGGKVRLF